MMIWAALGLQTLVIVYLWGRIIRAEEMLIMLLDHAESLLDIVRKQDGKTQKDNTDKRRTTCETDT